MRPSATRRATSTKSSRPSSAQCRSSKTRTSGLTLGHGHQEAAPGREASRRGGRPRLAPRLEPDKRREVSLAPSRPRARSAITASTVSSSFRLRSSIASVSRIPAAAFTISPDAQKLTPSPYGRDRPRCQETGPSSPVSSELDQLVDEPRLPDSRHADEVTSCGSTLLAHAGERVSKQAELPLAADERRAPQALDADGHPGAQRLPDRRSAAPFPSAPVGGGPPYSIAASVARYVASSTRIEPGAAAVWSRAAVLTTSPEAMPSPLSGRASRATSASPVVIPMRTSSSPSGERVADRERRAHRTLRVVLVRDRSTEHGHDRVADELLHGAAEALELGADARVVGLEQPPHVLRVHPLRAGGEADEVAEEAGDDLALLARRSAARATSRTPSRSARPPRSRVRSSGRSSRHGG